MMKCLIITGGNISEAFALPFLEEHSFDCSIAVDRGLDFFYSVNRRPDILVGDMDSANPLAIEYYKNQEGVKIEKLNPQKNDTDTEHAVHMAIDMGATQIVILGATGRRMDHFLGTVNLLGMGLEHQVEILLMDEYNRIRMINSSLTIPRREQYGKYVSLIPFSTRVEGVTLEGMKYPLKNGTLGGYNALGVSNEIVDEYGKIMVKKGDLIVIESKE